MFKKILIANRGEIALRIIWACRELGIQTVAVHSTADADSLHVKFADENVCIGPPRNTDSYLNIGAVLTAAEITDADAIHPGYGFLAESAHFAEVCGDCKIRFIGPSPGVMRLMGDKAKARETALASGVQVLPGSPGTVHDDEEARRIAEQIGYPIIVKATAGGGGRGMRIAGSDAELLAALPIARSEAKAAFAVPDVYLEKYIKNPRHIEIQILGDSFGNMVHLGERECSIQRRHQKILEESPSTAITPKVRRRMTEAALKLSRACGYENAGTIEFLLDEDGRFYFIEMNTRIQVEHPVTETVTGIDMIKEQIKISSGESLAFRQEDIVHSGHAVECRINAEDPVTFQPSPGTITTFHLPGGPGVRIDTAAHTECRIPPFYDSMIAKLITRGNNRMEAISRMRRSLEFMVVEGVKTNIPLHRRILNDPDFIRGNIHTGLLDRLLDRKEEAVVAS